MNTLNCTEITDLKESADEKTVREKYEQLTLFLIEKEKTITTMESCTSGMIASLLTDTEGASAILKGAFITYSNEAKILQGVPRQVIEEYGVYSFETAAQMACACRETYHADIGIGVTGSFRNADPANQDSIPGEVFFAIRTEKELACFHCSIPDQVSRRAYKIYMADLVADRLQECLSGVVFCK